MRKRRRAAAETHLLAHVVVAVQTDVADVARNAGLHGYPVTNLPTVCRRCIGAECHDLPGALVTLGQRLLDLDVPVPEVCVVVEVRTTERRGFHLDLHFIGVGIGDRSGDLVARGAVSRWAPRRTRGKRVLTSLRSLGPYRTCALDFVGKDSVMLPILR